MVGEQDAAGEMDMNSDTQIIVGLVQMVRSDSIDDKIVTKPEGVKKNTKSKQCVLIPVDSLSKISVNFTEIKEFRDLSLVVKQAGAELCQAQAS